MAITDQFDPAVDGWFFRNWKEEGSHCVGPCDLSWDLYRRTYLGIPPTPSAAGELDLAFYEIFKIVAKNGNCGGMALLALAIHKYGGYFGYCGPANFYGGGVSPDRDDLHQAINIFQARQFSGPGAQNFLDIAGAGRLTDADAAFNKIRAQLGNGDYAVISIAKNALAVDAHTIIPYAVDEHPIGRPPGTRFIYVWDSNHPYDEDPDYYTSGKNRIVIRSSFDWEYPEGVANNYSGSNLGWCFAVPMSIILRKARHPMALDILIDGLVSVFVGGPGAAVTQIEDSHGRRLFTHDIDSGNGVPEFETDPDRRLPDVVRWPWFGGGEPPGDLYFLRRQTSSDTLTFSVRGAGYDFTHAQGRNLVKIAARTNSTAKDRVTIGSIAGPLPTIEIKTDGTSRSYDVEHMRMFSSDTDWRSVRVRNARLTDAAMTILGVGDLESVQIGAGPRPLAFDLDLRRRDGGDIVECGSGHHSVGDGRRMQFAVRNWNRLVQEGVDHRSVADAPPRPPRKRPRI